MSSVLEQMTAQRVLPILRSATVRDAVETARACARAGMRVVELTQTTPSVEEALEELRAEGLLLGVGTLTSADQVGSAVDAGAQFVVSFARPAGFVERAVELGVPAIPGVLSPGEVLSACDAGAAAVKIFPARAVSPSYLSDLRTVMPELKAIVTGGLRASAASLRPWMDAGALAVGVGGDLGTVAEHGPDEVERRARGALEVVRAVTRTPT